jgi:hypothetical protein
VANISVFRVQLPVYFFCLNQNKSLSVKFDGLPVTCKKLRYKKSQFKKKVMLTADIPVVTYFSEEPVPVDFEGRIKFAQKLYIMVALNFICSNV